MALPRLLTLLAIVLSIVPTSPFCPTVSMLRNVRPNSPLHSHLSISTLAIDNALTTAPTTTQLARALKPPPPPISILAHFLKLRSTLATLSLTTLSTTICSLPPFPPFLYFTALLVAGFGIPVSEDLLVIYMFLTTVPARRTETLVAVYFGVILSDFVTYSIGKSTGVSYENVKLPKSVVRIQRKMSDMLPTSPLSSFLTGVTIRLAVGLRTPLMLMAGAGGKVCFAAYAAGTMVGALGSIGFQWAVARRVLMV